MVNIFRRFQQPMLIVITVLIIISFAWLYNTTQFDRPTVGHVATLYGKKVTQADFRRQLRRFEVCRELQMFDLLEGLAGRDAVMAMFMGRGMSDRAAEEFVWNSMILDREAEQLGIAPTTAEIDAAVKAMPRFQTNNAFNPREFDRFVREELGPRGFSGDEIEQVVRDQIRLRKVKELLGSTIEATPGEVRSIFELRNQKIEASLIRLKLADFQATAQVTDEEAQKLYEQKKDSLKSDEKRRVKYVAFTLEKQETPLPETERNAKLTELAEKAANFADSVSGKADRFDELAAKSGAKVGETPAFPQNDPPAELGESEQVAQEAFALTAENPVSEAIGESMQGSNGYYVVKLLEVVPSQPLTFEEAKPRLVEQLKQEKAMEAMSLKATEIRAKLDAELKAGKALSEAAQAAGVTVETVPPFSRMEPPRAVPDAQAFMGRVSDMKEGELSEFIPTGTGGLIVRVDKRQPIDEADFEKQKAQLMEGVAEMKREGLFHEWLKAQREGANLQVAQG
jgi:peptidyl-prolyl cis-trans isomerase D